MHILTATIAAAGTLMLPAHAHIVSISQHRHRLVHMADPAYDTCTRQSSFVRSRKDNRIIAEYVQCWGNELDNYSHAKLVVRYTR